MSETNRFRLPTAETEDAEEALVAAWVRREGGDARALSPEDEPKARDVVRRLRLAERLLTDVLTLEASKVEQDACRMEHVLGPDASEAICTLLGHPRFCPHGHAIPAGPCCAASRERLNALMKPLSAMAPGDAGRVAYLLSPDSPDAQRLLSMGLVPGAPLTLVQRKPAFVIEAGQNTLAVEEAVAEGVIVRVGRSS